MTTSRGLIRSRLNIEESVSATRSGSPIVPPRTVSASFGAVASPVRRGPLGPWSITAALLKPLPTSTPTVAFRRRNPNLLMPQLRRDIE